MVSESKQLSLGKTCNDILIREMESFWKSRVENVE